MTPEDDFRFVLFPQAKESQAKYEFKYNVEIGRKLKLVMSDLNFTSLIEQAPSTYNEFNIEKSKNRGNVFSFIY